MLHRWPRPALPARRLQAAGCGRIFSEKISTRVKVRPQLEQALTLAREIKQAAGIQLELLSGPLTGIYDPTGMGSMLFAVCAVAAQLDRDYIREKTLEGQRAAAARGNHGGRPKVIDNDMLLFACALRDRGEPIGEIAKKLTIKTGKNAGKHPSVASLYRALADTPERSPL